jgi:hypothetical protein
MSNNAKARDKQRPLKIQQWPNRQGFVPNDPSDNYISSLNALLIAESNLVAAGKDSAMSHLLAIVKELERIHCFTFELLDEHPDPGPPAEGL